MFAARSSIQAVLRSASRGGVLLLGVAAALTFSLRGVANVPEFDVEEVAPGNYVHLGRHASIEEPGREDIANIGFIVGKKCVAVVDTGGSARVGMALKSAIRERTQLPICYVINTHVHFDHLLGNRAFREEKPEFIGHAELPGAVLSNRKYFVEHFGAELGEGATEADVIAPDRTVDTMLELDLGGRTLLLRAYPKAHTATDVTVFDEATGTLWAGDLLFRTRIPSLDGSIKGWLDVIDGLEQQQNVKVVIPGHGQVGDDLRAALADERRYLQVLVDEVRADIDAGKPLEEAMDEVGVSERDHWQLFDDVHKRNVTRAYTELEWE
jgi:quinoprotein relay system zinc metallohydrolase 2